MSNIFHDERCCMNGVQPGRGPADECPGQQGAPSFQGIDWAPFLPSPWKSESWQAGIVLGLLIGRSPRVGTPVGWLVTGSILTDRFFPFEIKDGQYHGHILTLHDLLVRRLA